MSEDKDISFADYWRLSFYGRGVPAIFLCKEFIFRGVWKTDRMMMKQILASQFAGAQWVEDPVKIDDIKESVGIWIDITKVLPLTFKDIQSFGIADKIKDRDELLIGEFYEDLPRNLKEYYQENFKNMFYKESMISSFDVRDEMLRDKLIEIYKVKQNFPSIFCMQEIVETEQIRRTAIDEAIRDVEKQNDEFKN